MSDACLIAGASASNAGRVRERHHCQYEWQSAEVLSNLDKFILNEGYGCSAEIHDRRHVPTITSHGEKGQPDIAPEA